MTKTLPLWAALLFGVICGAVIGTIVAAFYLTLALKTGFQSFDMLALWKASAGTRAAHPEAFKVGFGAVGFGVHRPRCSGAGLDLEEGARRLRFRPLADQGGTEEERHAAGTRQGLCLWQARLPNVQGGVHLLDRHPPCDDGGADPRGQGCGFRDPEPS